MSENPSFIDSFSDTEDKKIFSSTDVEPVIDFSKKTNELRRRVNLVRGLLLSRRNSDILEKYDKKSLIELRDVLSELSSAREDEDFKSLAESQRVKRPDLFIIYSELAQYTILKNHTDVDNAFQNFIVDKDIDTEILVEINKRIIRLGSELGPETQKLLQENFPSGNYLLHSTGIKGFLNILESGELISSAGIALKNNKPWKEFQNTNGGTEGISFNFNKTRILMSEDSHFFGLVIDPQLALDDSHQLIVPYGAAPNEVQLTSKFYKNNNIYNERELPDPTKELGYSTDELPILKANQCFIFCNELDVHRVTAALAAAEIIPKGVLAYPNSEIRVPATWNTDGDHEKASLLFDNAFRQAGLRHTINWEHDLFTQPPETDGVHTSDHSVDEAKIIIKQGETLEVVPH